MRCGISESSRRCFVVTCREGFSEGTLLLHSGGFCVACLSSSPAQQLTLPDLRAGRAGRGSSFRRSLRARCHATTQASNEWQSVSAGPLAEASTQKLHHSTHGAEPSHGTRGCIRRRRGVLGDRAASHRLGSYTSPALTIPSSARNDCRTYATSRKASRKNTRRHKCQRILQGGVKKVIL